MNTKQYLENNLLKIIDNARFAPSVHNSQPWKVGINDNSIEISLDERYALSDGDPTGRQTILSLGIFAEAILISAEAEGLQNAAIRYSDKKAFVIFSNDPLSTKPENKEIVKALRHRATDRSIYKKVDVSSQVSNIIKKSWLDSHVKIWIVGDAKNIDKIADLTASGIGLALTSPDFRKELSRYIVEPWSKKQRGISVNSLYVPRLLAICEPLLIRLGIGLGSEVKLEKKRWKSASAIVLITTEGDMPEYWFSAGRAYLRASLAIEQLGFSQATSAATVEASNYHEDVEKILNTRQRLQCVLRIGRGSSRRAFSPRVDAKSLIS